MGYYTAIILPTGEQALAAHMLTSCAIAVENCGGLARLLRGRGVNKVVLINLTKAEVNSEILETLDLCGMTYFNETGTRIPFVEV